MPCEFLCKLMILASRSARRTSLGSARKQRIGQMPRGAVDRSNCLRTTLPSHSGHRKSLGAISTEDQRPQFADSGRRVGRRNGSDSRNAPSVYRRHRGPNAQPGDPYANAFVSEVGQCWRMIHDRQGQADHCHETPSWTGRWFSPSGDQLVASVGLSGPSGGLDGFAGVRSAEELALMGTNKDLWCCL